MLDPYFYRCPQELQLNMNALNSKFSLVAYAQVSNYTLIVWKFSQGDDEGISGEILYKDREIVVCTGGSLNLPGDTIPDDTAFNPWERIGNVEISMVTPIAQSLRKNINYLQN